MKVLMLGWEFPPFITGGLGTACFGLTKAMSDLGTEVLFVLPRPVDESFPTHVKVVSPSSLTAPPASADHPEQTRPASAQRQPRNEGADHAAETPSDSKRAAADKEESPESAAPPESGPPDRRDQGVAPIQAINRLPEAYANLLDATVYRMEGLDNVLFHALPAGGGYCAYETPETVETGTGDAAPETAATRSAIEATETADSQPRSAQLDTSDQSPEPGLSKPPPEPPAGGATPAPHREPPPPHINVVPDEPEQPESSAAVTEKPTDTAAPAGEASGHTTPPAPEPAASEERVSGIDPPHHYGGDLFAELEKYANMATLLANLTDFDVVHAHDWMTFRAGIAVASRTGKPLVIHVHSTVFDRSGDNIDQNIYDIEREGMHAAQRIIAVSFLTKNVIVSRYGVPAEKVQVVHNAIEVNGQRTPPPAYEPIKRGERVVLFLGRITTQKGPEYFVKAAEKVLSVMPNVRFIMAGSGDMIRYTIELAASLGIGHRVLFTGFLRGEDVERVYRMADLYVMPSVSEPFGITPLEALSHDVPAIISRQSGVSEVLKHVLRADFWDVEELADKIVAVLRHAPLSKMLREQGSLEVRRMTWADSASQCITVYESLQRDG